MIYKQIHFMNVNLAFAKFLRKLFFVEFFSVEN